MIQFLARYLLAPSVLALLFLPFTADAAALYLDPATSVLHIGDSSVLSVRIDTDESTSECINAVSAVLTYSSNIEPVDVSIADSIFSMWIEQPVIDRKARTISFAGGIPNGYCGRVSGDPRLTNVIAQIVVRTPGFTIGGGDAVESTNAIVEFTDETTAYLNDGQGTMVGVTTYPAKFEISKTAGNTLLNPWQDRVNEDKIPPEKFSILLQKGDHSNYNKFSEKFYVAFNTVDKQTGIDQYQIMEEPLSQFGTFQWGRADAPWVTVKSPYILKDQSLNSVIRVKAIDKAGNEYVATLIPDDSLRTTSSGQFAFVITLVLGLSLLIILVYYVLRITKRRRKFSSSDAPKTQTSQNADSESDNNPKND